MEVLGKIEMGQKNPLMEVLGKIEMGQNNMSMVTTVHEKFKIFT